MWPSPRAWPTIESRAPSAAPWVPPRRPSSGWLACARVTITTLQPKDSVVFTAISDHGELLDANQCRRLFDLEIEKFERWTGDRRDG